MSTQALGTVNDAAERYRTDAATIWAWITSERVVTNPNGCRVQLVADKAKRYGPNGSTWLIEEVSA